MTIALSLIIRSHLASNIFDAQINRGVNGQNLERKWSTDVSQILKRSRSDIALSHAKEIVSISSAVWAQCTNVTDRQTDII